MALFLKADFLMKALEFKHSPQGRNTPSFAGLRYEPFLYHQARLVFPKYSQGYPENKEFMEKIVKDYDAHNPELLKIIHPDGLTVEHEAENNQFELDAQTEHQATQEATKEPFTLAEAHSKPHKFGLIPEDEEDEEEDQSTMESEDEEEKGQSQPQTQSQESQSQPQSQSQSQPQSSRSQKRSPEQNRNPKSRFRRIPQAAKNSARRIAGNLRGPLGRMGGGALKAGARLSKEVSGKSLLRMGVSKKVKIAILINVLLLLFTTVVMASLFPEQDIQTVGAAPAPNGLTYTLPLKDSSVSPVDIRNQIKTAFPNAKLEYWDLIIQTAKGASINPAVALALWIEETGASQTTVVRNGGSGIPTSSGSLTMGHLGCAPTEDQTINESLSCLIKFINSNNFTNDQFPQFMAKYSGGPASNPFSNNPNFVNNFRNWYVRLVPSGSGAVKNITPTPGTSPGTPINPGSLGFALSCPLGNSFTVTCGTAANPMNNCGHGGLGYNSTCDPTYYVCNGARYSDALYHAIDVRGGSSVRLPFINGTEPIEWVKDGGVIAIGGGSWGYRINYRATYQGKRIYLDLTHLNQQINSAPTLHSGDEVGTVFTGIGHLHTAVSVDDRWVEPMQELRMCSN